MGALVEEYRDDLRWKRFKSAKKDIIHNRTLLKGD
ncbi:hypothetical protein HBHAL_2014 [Halobacillus halophilus DSM 2266]|uniref:Uncharacterized protein n=1 Tax=Halobacillus halophilus (strain ATCC 35676 / DSM 2266 / JCM 20832 / KCTC 3685 / LMG 17431 / NBRC 102448 / NCIMB 2269) TaxID=866895 RepID=I0JJQ6_HALH3|nr:hypothetical protein HBHAL_2014 [Halobacillus halophilus DSM 2266]